MAVKLIIGPGLPMLVVIRVTVVVSGAPGTAVLQTLLPWAVAVSSGQHLLGAVMTAVAWRAQASAGYSAAAT